MKKFVNRPENAVEAVIEGLAVLSSGAMRLPGHKVMIRVDSEKVRELQVVVISGGGNHRCRAAQHLSSVHQSAVLNAMN
jgi:dihydroxyacetone kinase